jgi:WD40 repeat protein
LVILKDGVEIERRDFAVVRADDQKKLVVPETLLKPGKITQLSAHTGEVTSVAFSGDGLRLISVGPVAADGAFIWDVPTGKQVHHYIRGKKTLKGATWSGALSFDGHAALIGGTHVNKAGVLKPWLTAIGLESGTRLWESGDHTRRINSVAFSADGKFALSADEAGFTKIWNAGKEERLFQLAGSVACFGPSSRHVVTAVKSEAHLWELSNPPKELKVFKGHSDLIRSIAFATDGQHILTGGDATLRLWNIAADKEVQIFKGHDKEVTSVAISPDGRYALSGSKDKTVRLWNVSDGSEVLRFTEHTDVVNSVAYSPGGRRVASGSNDRTVRLWAVPK